MNVTVLIATYNRAAMLGETIDAFAAQRTPPALRWELLVVDNNSRDDTRGVVDRYAQDFIVPLRYLFEPRQGKSHALNAGIRVAQGEVIAFIDDDVLVPPDWVATVQRVMDRWSADGAGGRILPRWEISPPQWLVKSPLLRARLALVEVEAPEVLAIPMTGQARIWGANMVLRRTVFDQIGGFDVRLGPTGTRAVNYEDYDMLERAITSGHKVVYDPELTVYHRIPAARMRKGHFRRWEFNTALAVVLRNPMPKMRRFSLLGRPLSLYRKTAIALMKWLIAASLRQPVALQAELDFFGAAGILWWYPESLRQTERG